MPTAPVQDGPFEAMQPLDVSAPGSGQLSTPGGQEAAQAPSRATFLRGFVHAWNGIAYAFRTQRNARVHFAVALAVTAAGIALRVSILEFALLCLAMMAVMVAELVNTVAEAIVDLVTQEYHPLAKVAKDVGAGAVLVAAMFAVVIGVLVLGPHLWVLGMHLLAH
jgi:diacylglycerol kinase